MKTICVIGAGPIGLAASKCFLQEGFLVTVYEQGDQLGGVWKYEEGSPEELSRRGVYASAYRSLTTNSSRYLNSFSDFIPNPGERHADHAEIVRYLEDYAAHYRVSELIHYCHKVVDVSLDIQVPDPLFPARWRVSTECNRDGNIVISHSIFDGVIVCSGQYWKPKRINYPGQANFKGQSRHSHYYRHPGFIRGETVLIVGVGNSAFDIAIELAASGKRVLMSSRSGTRVMTSKTPENEPLDSWLFTRERQSKRNYMDTLLKFNEFSRPLHSACLRAGMPAPHSNPIKSHYSIVKKPELLISLLESRAIAFKPNIRRLFEDSIEFTDGTTECCDTIIECTGYHLTFPFLEGHPSLLPGVVGQRLDLYRHVMHPKYPNLCVLGQIDSLGSMFAIGEMQARWAAGVLAGRVACCSEEERVEWVARYVEKIEKIQPKFLSFLNYYAYMEMLAHDIGCIPVTEKGLVSEEHHRRLTRGTTFPFHYRINGPLKWEKAVNFVAKL